MPEKRKSLAKIAVIGGGSWATAIVKILTHNRHEVRWWVRQEETAEFIRQYHHNPKYLSSVTFSPMPKLVSHRLEAVLKGADYVVFGVPSAYLKFSIRDTQPADWKGKVIISAIKGLVQPENVSVSQYMASDYGFPVERVVNISGPCHAEEVAAEKLSYLTFSGLNADMAQEVADLFDCRFLKAKASTDLYGAEYASVLKNVYALGAGISVGLGYGDNFRAVYVSAAMEEMRNFLDTSFPGQRSVLAPTYLGDTLVTAYSPYSRNRTFGVMIGKGYSVQAATLELNMVAEGYYATESLFHVARRNNLRLPILEAMHNILYGKISPGIEFHLLADKLG